MPGASEADQPRYQWGQGSKWILVGIFSWSCIVAVAAFIWEWQINLLESSDQDKISIVYGVSYAFIVPSLSMIWSVHEVLRLSYCLRHPSTAFLIALIFITLWAAQLTLWIGCEVNGGLATMHRNGLCPAIIPDFHGGEAKAYLAFIPVTLWMMYAVVAWCKRVEMWKRRTEEGRPFLERRESLETIDGGEFERGAFEEEKV